MSYANLAVCDVIKKFYDLRKSLNIIFMQAERMRRVQGIHMKGGLGFSENN